MLASTSTSDVRSTPMSVAEPIVELLIKSAIVPPFESIPEPTVVPVVEPAIVHDAMPNAKSVVLALPLRNPIRNSTRTSSKPTYL